MINKKLHVNIIFIISRILSIICLLAFLTSCTPNEMKQYYADMNNYVNATGMVTHISYNDDESALYISFSALEPQFDDNCFKIVGDNLKIVQNNGINQKLAIGEYVEFVTAPRYFGDGYVMPIGDKGTVLLSPYPLDRFGQERYNILG